MPGNPLVRFDEGRVGRTERCRPLSYSTDPEFHDLLGRDFDRLAGSRIAPYTCFTLDPD